MNLKRGLIMECPQRTLSLIVLVSCFARMASAANLGSFSEEVTGGEHHRHRRSTDVDLNEDRQNTIVDKLNELRADEGASNMAFLVSTYISLKVEKTL